MSKEFSELKQKKIQISLNAFNEECMRVRNKIAEYADSGINPDRELYMMYVARQNTLDWISKMDEWNF